MRKVLVALWAMGALAGCGDTNTVPPPSGGGGGDGGAPTATITISNFTFFPSDLVVSPGTVVTVVNGDGANLHSVTSSAVAGTFVFGAVNGVSFDTGPFTGQVTFTIPSDAPVGTVVPYYCTVHLGAMLNQAQITIQ